MVVKPLTDEGQDRYFLLWWTSTGSAVILTEEEAREAWGKLGAELEKATEDE